VSGKKKKKGRHRIRDDWHDKSIIVIYLRFDKLKFKDFINYAGHLQKSKKSDICKIRVSVT
jgi:hypothetical protein